MNLRKYSYTVTYLDGAGQQAHGMTLHDILNGFLADYMKPADVERVCNLKPDQLMRVNPQIISHLRVASTILIRRTA